VRALLIVNPYATSTTAVRREVITRALASELDLNVVQTRYRGHAGHVAEGAARDQYELVLALGGDGTVNEVVNGMLRVRPPGAGAPLFAPLPGGSANVFTRSLGLPADLVDATGHLLGALRERRTRSIGLGLAGQRYFCANAGLGLDAEVVRVVEGLRARGRGASAAMYVWAAVRQFCAVTNRRVPALSLERQMLSPGGGPSGRHVVSLHDQPALTFRAARPMAFQVDGEYVGEHEHVMLRSIPNALRVLV